MDDEVKDFSYEDILRIWVFQDFSRKIKKMKFNFNIFWNKRQIYKLVKNFEARGTCEDWRAACFSPLGFR